jgi:UDP-4-amino-4,6-dideoxy-N-acetyl-beta-L-altrosamine transaminase
MIPYGRQDVTQSDIDAIVEVLRSDNLTQGPSVASFEEAICARVGAKHAVAANSATSALHIACLALELGPGDILWTVPNTFVASANCGRYCGAEVDFVDIDPQTMNLSVDRLKEKLFLAKKSKRLPKVVVPVHFGGQPTDQEAIWALAREFGFKVLEDASHAIGATRNGEPVGSCRWSDISIFSFHPVKIITTGEGGMALTNDDTLAQRMLMLRGHGITRDAKLLHIDDPAPRWYYEQQLLGYNYRMSDMHAILGLSQLRRLDDYLARRQEIVARYDSLLADLPIRKPHLAKGNFSSWHLYVIHVEGKRRAVFDAMRAADILVNVHYMPVHLQPYYRVPGRTEGSFPESERHGEEAITLPVYPRLTDDEQDYVVSVLSRALAC